MSTAEEYEEETENQLCFAPTLSENKWKKHFLMKTSVWYLISFVLSISIHTHRNEWFAEYRCSDDDSISSAIIFYLCNHFQIVGTTRNESL